MNRIKLLISKKQLVLFTLIFVCLLSLFFCSKDNSKTGDYDKILPTILNNKNTSIFNIKGLNTNDLKDRIILLNVYSVNDFSYMFSLDLAEKMNNIFKNKITIIDVLRDESKLNNNMLINYIIKNSIERPIINMSNEDLSKILDYSGNYFILIDDRGIVQKQWNINEIDEEDLTETIKSLLKKTGRINTTKLSDLSLEKDKTPEPFIKSLNHIKYIDKLSENNTPYFIITDMKGRKVYITTLDGNIIKQIGSGKNGKANGVATNASFCYPFGITIKDNKFLYVSDTCNNLIRKVDLNTLETSNLLEIEKPLDIEIFNDELIISTAGENPLMKYNMETEKLSKIDCPFCSKNIFKLDKYNNKIYFLNSSDNTLYSLNEKDEINKEIDFKELNSKNKININDNYNFHIDETGFYFADKYNNRILKVKDNQIKEYSNNKNEIYNIPTDIIDVKDKLYITNENDKKLIQLDKNTNNTKVININFGYEYNKLKTDYDSFLEIKNMKEFRLNPNFNSEIILNLKNGYSFEKMAPQSLTVFEEDKENNSAILIKSYSKDEIIKNSILKLPDLDEDTVYYIKGDFYYCNYTKETPCLINKYSKKIIIDKSSKTSNIVIDFLY